MLTTITTQRTLIAYALLLNASVKQQVVECYRNAVK
jgi:hypothetical protein